MVLSLLSVLLFKWWYAAANAGKTSGGFILITIVGIILLMAIYYGITKLVERTSISGPGSIKLTEPLSSIHRAILAEKFDYYNQLSKTDKDLFEKRVRYYMVSKMYTSEDGYAVTDEMKVLIAAAVAQITFGIAVIANTNYTHILVMPNGAMTPKSASRNTIVVPWREFLDGYMISDDGKNEGMKVIASALVRDNRLQDKAYKIFAPKKYEHWKATAYEEVNNFMSGMFQAMDKDDRVRDEYFAMAVIYFFELPVAFKQKYPSLYASMSNLLGQDTASKMGRK